MEKKPLTREITHDQHYVSQFYLGRFGKDGRVYGYDVRRHKGKIKGTGGWCKLYDFYEVTGLESNELERRFASIECKCAPYFEMMSNGEALDYDDTLPVLKFASMTHIRSPVMLQTCIEKIGMMADAELRREKVIEASKRMILTGLRSAEGHFFGIPYKDLAISYTTWDHDVLVTSDNPVVFCNLYDLSFTPKQGIFEGFIFPIDMRTLVMVFKVSDIKLFEETFKKTEGMINPKNVNYIMVENAVRWVFFKDESNPIFNVIDQIVLNPEMEDVYEFIERELIESERQKKNAKQQ